jgi:hypothetical protein
MFDEQNISLVECIGRRLRQLVPVFLIFVFILPANDLPQGVTFSFVDAPANPPSGVTGEVDNTSHRYRVVGIANPHTSKYVHILSDPFLIPLLGINTTVFEADVSLPTGLRTGIPGSSDPLGDNGSKPPGDDTLGTPVLFRISFSWCTFVEISMQSTYGLALEQMTNCSQTPDEISPNSGPARSYTAISKWTGGPVDFDPLGLIQTTTIGSQFHVRLSIDFYQNKVMAEITPKPGLEGNFNPFLPSHGGGIAAPFIAVTNLIDYTKDPDFTGSIFYGIHIRTTGNTDVDNPSAPGGTLRYIDREFTNAQVTFNQNIDFPPIPILPQVVFPADDFDNGVIGPTWSLAPVTDISFSEGNGALKMAGIPEENGYASFSSPSAQRQDITVEMDFRSPTGLQDGSDGAFRLQFDAFNYIQVQIGSDGYRLLRAIGNNIGEVGDPLPLFGDETTNFHRIKLVYKDATGHVEAFVDDRPLGGIEDKLFSSSLTDFQFVFYNFVVDGQYIDREWDNFMSIGNRVFLPLILRNQ